MSRWISRHYERASTSLGTGRRRDIPSTARDLRRLVMRAKASCVAMVLLAGCVVRLEGSNNERATNGWGYDFEASSGWGRTRNDLWLAAVTNIHAHSGRSSLWLEVSGSAQDGGVDCWTDPDRYGPFAGKGATLSAWALRPHEKAHNHGRGLVELWFFDASQNLIELDPASAVVIDENGPTDTWVFGTVSAPIPEGCVWIEAVLRVSCVKDGAVCFDDVALTIGPTTTCASVTRDIEDGSVFSRDPAGEAWLTNAVSDNRVAGGECDGGTKPAGTSGVSASSAPAQPKADDETGDDQHSYWWVAGPYMMHSGWSYDSNCFMSLFSRLPSEWQGSGPAMQFVDIPRAWRRDSDWWWPSVMPGVVWGHALGNGTVHGYFQVRTRVQAFCRVTTPFACMRIEGKWRSMQYDVMPNGTNILLTFDPEEWRPGETNGVIRVDLGVNGVCEVPVPLVCSNGQWEPKDAYMDAATNRRGLEGNDWRRRGSFMERPKGLDSMGEDSVLLAQKTWVSPLAQPGELRLGSDDAVKVWQNGKPIFTYPHTRGYTKGRNVVPVSLAAGTNSFLFALVNGPSKANLGAEVFPAAQPLDGQLVLQADDTAPGRESPDKTMLLTEQSTAAHTGDWVVLDYCWTPASGTGSMPRLAAWATKPACDWLQVYTSASNGIAYTATNVPASAFPLKVTMRGKPAGVYAVEALWTGRRHTSRFIYLGSGQTITDTQRWWIHLAGERQVDMCDLFAKYKGDEDFGARFSGRTVRAFRSRIDNTLQPYGILVPENLAGQTGCPLLVRLEAVEQPREDWSLDHLEDIRRPGDWIELMPCCRGGTPHDGLIEIGVLEAVEDACRVFGIDRTRIVLEGDCAGSEGCWLIASHRPDQFAAIIPYGSFDSSVFDGNRLFNLRNVPVWHQQPDGWHLDRVSEAVRRLASIGDDARITVNQNAAKGQYNQAVLTDMKRWALTKRLDESPTQVFFTTYGDVDGAYWVRNIMPRRFGLPASVRAEWDKASNAMIRIMTRNVGTLALDLGRPLFTQCPTWQIRINGVVVTNVASGALWIHPPGTTMAARGSPAKRNGFCGGVADVVNAPFCMAYATGEDSAETLGRALELHSNLVGADFWKINGNFPVVADTNLTGEACTGRNIILCVTPRTPGPWLRSWLDTVPIAFAHGLVTIGGRSGREAVCLYPSPLAPGRYLLVVATSNAMNRVVHRARWDVWLDGGTGSFDLNWQAVAWDGPASHRHEEGERANAGGAASPRAAGDGHTSAAASRAGNGWPPGW